MLSLEGALERIFSLAFRGLVYPQSGKIRWLTWRQ
jgi:hypothetical protein